MVTLGQIISRTARRVLYGLAAVARGRAAGLYVSTPTRRRAEYQAPNGRQSRALRRKATRAAQPAAWSAWSAKDCLYYHLD